MDRPETVYTEEWTEENEKSEIGRLYKEVEAEKTDLKHRYFYNLKEDFYFKLMVNLEIPRSIKLNKARQDAQIYALPPYKNYGIRRNLQDSYENMKWMKEDEKNKLMLDCREVTDRAEIAKVVLMGV